MTLSRDGVIELNIININEKDAGIYTCVANNEVGQAESSATIEVVESIKEKEASNAVAELSVIQKPLP